MLYDFNDPIMQLNGRNVIYIENYKKLLGYSKTQIKILAKSGVLEVNGKNLEIQYYSKEDLKIKGYIESILFLE